MKLDYSIESAQERVAYVEKLLETYTPTQAEIGKLSDYIVFAQTKEEKKKREILTYNRLTTINKRESSYEALLDKNNREEEVHKYFAEDPMLQKLCEQDPITEEDLESIPPLRLIKEEINKMQQELQSRKDDENYEQSLYPLKKAIIQMQQDQYVIRNAAKERISGGVNLIKSAHTLDLSEDIHLNPENGEVLSNAIITCFNPDHVSNALRCYSELKQELEGSFAADLLYFLWDLDNLIYNKIRKQHPLLYTILVYKIDGFTNLEIQSKIGLLFGVYYSPEYISSLWRHKIPKKISEEAKKEWLYNHYKKLNKLKTCSKCGKHLPPHNLFFSKNKSSKDGFYSICKQCRKEKSNG